MTLKWYYKIEMLRLEKVYQKYLEKESLHKNTFNQFLIKRKYNSYRRKPTTTKNY